MKDLDNILVIDTVSDQAMVALNGQVVTWDAHRNHSDQLLGIIDKAMKSQKVTLKQLRGVVVATGPSTSFTGVRAGITVANGIGFGLNIPVAGVTEFDIVSAIYPKLDWYFLDAKRQEVFFKHGQQVGLGSVLEIEKQIKKGESVYLPAEIVEEHFTGLEKAGTIVMYSADPEERAIAMLKSASLSGKTRQVLPLYIRGANISKPNPAKKKSQ